MIVSGKQHTRSNYDKYPVVDVPDSWNDCVEGWESVAETLSDAVLRRANVDDKVVLCVDCYPGVDVEVIAGELSRRLSPASILFSESAFHASERIDGLVAPFLRENDNVFGRIADLTLADFFDSKKVDELRARIDSIESGIVLLVGCGARYVDRADILVYADMPRWEIQQRFRSNRTSNLGIDNKTERPGLQYRRAFFVDWKVCDRWKTATINQWDFVLETCSNQNPKLATAEVVRRGIRETAMRPFRVVPFFDPAPWGGQWMKDVCNLDPQVRNFGWCFDCVPEENSLLLGLGGIPFEIPSVNVVYAQPQLLLGKNILDRFGAEFPIRFDFLDTIGGGNLSFQVHPLEPYIRKHFGMSHTQDESYYILDAEEDATVYLGLREGIDPQAMRADLRNADRNAAHFDAEAYVNMFPAKKHDHFLIPAGTCHCSGKNAMVLEISATPFNFTFKMWDWGRPGLDGRPWPIHVEDGINNIQWDRTTSWVRNNLVNNIVPLESGDGWREEKTGLHELEFIETRRHWFTKKTPHHTRGTVHVLNLVQGNEVVVESPDGAFDPLVVHYAETFIVPASVGLYTIRPLDPSSGKTCATIKAYVRD